MVHPDHEARVVAHRIFSVILVPTAVSDPRALDVPRTLSRAVTGFYSSASLFEKLRLEKRSSSERFSQYNKENIAGEIELVNSNAVFLNRLKVHSRVSSVNNPPLLTEVKEITANSDQDLVSLALMSIHLGFDYGPSVVTVFNLPKAQKLDGYFSCFK